MEDFKIDLNALSNAIDSVTRESGGISSSLDQLDTKMRHLSAYWHSPAYDSFDDVRNWFRQASDDLTDMLDEIINRLQKAYDNYHEAESTNYANVDHHLPVTGQVVERPVAPAGQGGAQNA
ncbi:WXG100 family type VII secretion target [Actinomadura sp. DC4]|uniref:WXG100 family type VII secretion target n=1 Tax=Actinomadura sp. DC4 TaxID=3055069 RepID=UPI0025B19817|nr:WXG100 family type VII secretion target [Actinomadura sp. DC4]MDN3354936.1 WXG100 family type VII secretion target [Actinomadura sp. DC4]